MKWYLAVLKKYAEFDGRACRKEYWMFILFNLVIGLIGGFVMVVLGVILGMTEAQGDVLLNVFTTLYSLVIMLPALAVLVRRLHDTNRSGWCCFISLIPLVGPIILIVFLAQDSGPVENQYGPNPKAIRSAC